MINNVGIVSGNCFELEIEELAKSIDYPELAYFENIVLQFKIDKGNLKSDLTFAKNRLIVYQDIIQEIEKIDIKSKCPDVPNLIKIRFEFQWTNSIDYENGELIIRKNSLAIPTRAYSFFCTNASINKKFEKRKIGPQVIEGNNIVFVNCNRNYGNPFIPQEQQQEIIYFQIPTGIEEFEYKNEELEALNLYYENYWTQGEERELIKKARIKGKLESKIWIIVLSFKGREFRFIFPESSEINKL